MSLGSGGSQPVDLIITRDILMYLHQYWWYQLISDALLLESAIFYLVVEMLRDVYVLFIQLFNLYLYFSLFYLFIVSGSLNLYFHHDVYYVTDIIQSELAVVNRPEMPVTSNPVAENCSYYCCIRLT